MTDEEPMKMRDPDEAAILTRAHGIAQGILTDDVIELKPDDLTDGQTIAFAYAILASDLMKPYTERLQVCGWCVAAAGGTEDAWRNAEAFTLDGVRDHTMTCNHNPLVQKTATLRAELAEHFPIAITARAMLNDAATMTDLREIVDVIGNGSAEVRMAHLPERLRG